jgi:quercetin dioxygenase-like cupin family protein
MQHSRIIATALTVALATFSAARLEAQSEAGTPVWETLLRAPLPKDSLPKISVLSLPVSPAPPVPRAPGAGHTHAGPVFAYVLQGEIENQVEPDLPQIYRPGGVFYEVPGHVHRFLRNMSTTEPAQLIIFQAGNTGKPAPVIKTLLEEPLLSTINQELSLLRLTLPPSAVAEARTHSNPDVVYVLEGKIETTSAADTTKISTSGDLFVMPANRAKILFRNASDSETAKLLIYQASDVSSPGGAQK